MRLVKKKCSVVAVTCLYYLQYVTTIPCTNQVSKCVPESPRLPTECESHAPRTAAADAGGATCVRTAPPCTERNPDQSSPVCVALSGVNSSLHMCVCVRAHVCV